MKISVVLEALTGSFETDMKRASKTAQKELDQLKDRASKAGKAIGAALVAGAGALAAVVNQNLQAIATYQDLADKVGDTASQISSLKPAADLAETSLETVAAASVKLTAALSKTDDESKGVGKALAAIGLEMESFKKLAPVAQIDAVAKALNGFEDGASKTAIAVQLFGKSGADLIPFLKDLGEQTERNTTLTNEQIMAADEYVKAVARAKSEVSVLAQEFSARLAPTMQLIVQRFVNATKESGFLSGAIKALEVTLKTLVAGGAVVGEVFNFLGKSVGSTAAAIVAVADGDWSRAKDILVSAGKDIKASAADTSKFINELYSGATAAVTNQAAATGNAAKKTLEYSAATDKATTSTKAQKDTLKDFNKEIDNYIDSMIDAEDQALEMPRQFASLRESLLTPLEQFNAQVTKLNEFRAAGLDSETYRRGIEAAKEQLDTLAKVDEKVGEVRNMFEETVLDMGDIAEAGAKGIQSALADFLFDPFEGGLKGMLKGFGETLRRMAAEAAASQIINGLINLGMSAFSGGSLPGLDKPISGALATGGNMLGGSAYLVGERGPELFIPDQSGSIIPNGKSAGMTVVQNFTVQAPQGSVSRQTQQQIGAAAQRGLSQASRRNN